MPPSLPKRWQAKQPAAANIFRPFSKLRFFKPRSTAGASVSSFQSVTVVRPAKTSAICAKGDFFSGFFASTTCKAVFSLQKLLEARAAAIIRRLQEPFELRGAQLGGPARFQETNRTRVFQLLLLAGCSFNHGNGLACEGG
jgi:hypothetical protein